MKKKILFAIIFLFLFVVANGCNNRSKEKENTVAATTAEITTESYETETTSEDEFWTTEDIIETEKPTIQTYPKNVNYQEIFDENKKRLSENSFFRDLREADDAYAKTWISDDKKLSLIIKTKYGPLGDGGVEGTYTVNGKEYKVSGIINGPHSVSDVGVFDIYYYSAIEGKTDVDNLRYILIGDFTYDSQTNSFTVTANKYIDHIYPDTVDGTVPVDKYGDKSIPVYSNGEKVTFYMQ